LLVASVVIVAEVWLCGAAAVFTRPLWLDEIHTVLVAGRQDTLTSMQSLRAGADFNPPTLYLLFRGIAALTGGLSPTMMRIVAVASVVATLPIVYALLRDQFSPLPSAIGAFAVWAQSVVVTEAFDARFYGPWLFGAAILSLAVRNALNDERRWINGVFLVIASVFVCTIHYFGILSWSGAVFAAIWFAEGERHRRVIRLLPALAGPLALAMCAPFYLGQRAALTTATWIPDLSLVSAILLLVTALVAPPVAVTVIGWVASRLMQRTPPPASTPAPTRRFALGSALLLGQALVPVALAIFSLTVQPAMQPRYSIAAALWAAPIVALAFAQSTLLFRVIGAAAIVVSSVRLVSDEGARARARARDVQQDIDQVSRIATADTTVVVRWRHSLYPILIDRPALASRLALFDATSLAPNDKFAAVERDVARVHLRHYGVPRIVTPADADSIPAFYFLEIGFTRGPTATEFPGRRIQRVSQRLFRIDRAATSANQPAAPAATVDAVPKP
jgi:hypothetical protein